VGSSLLRLLYHFGAELARDYVVWDQWVRSFGGLTCDFAGVFEGFIFGVLD
jgi:hypothetical protein